MPSRGTAGGTIGGTVAGTIAGTIAGTPARVQQLTPPPEVPLWRPGESHMLSRMRATPGSELPSAADQAGGSASGFDPTSTFQFQAKMKRAPVWFCSFLAGNQREQRRFRDELVQIKGAWPLLMKQRNGGQWTAEDKARLKTMVRSASSVSPYLFIWAIPGSMLLLPFLAWYLDNRRKRRR